MSSRITGRLLMVAWAVLGLAVLASPGAEAGLGLANMAGSAHDFRSQTVTYPVLSGLAGNEICRACHVPHNADKERLMRDFGQEWGAPTDKYGNSRQLLLPGSVLCLGCHDGTIAQPTQSDSIPTGNLSRITPVGDPHYFNDILPGWRPPGPIPERSADFIASLQAAVVQEADGQWVARSPVTGTRLPLYSIGDGPRMACTTCHDPHVENFEGAGSNFLRSAQPYGDLCVTCHSGMWP